MMCYRCDIQLIIYAYITLHYTILEHEKGFHASKQQNHQTRERGGPCKSRSDHGGGGATVKSGANPPRL